MDFQSLRAFVAAEPGGGNLLSLVFGVKADESFAEPPFKSLLRQRAFDIQNTGFWWAVLSCVDQRITVIIGSQAQFFFVSWRKTQCRTATPSHLNDLIIVQRQYELCLCIVKQPL